MTTTLISAAVVSVCLLAYAVYVIVRVVRFDDYSPSQKLLQSLIALFIPLFGPLLVHMVLRVNVVPPPKKDKNFDPDYIGSGS